MTAPARLDVFAPITKRERDPKTGHLYVYGKITGPDLDRDMQAMDADWLKAAVPEWFTRGNIREQHDAKRAIGKAVELTEKGDGWYIGAKIVDRAAAEKVEEGVLTGFSIGIKGPRLDYTKADVPNGLVTGGRICETSLVDVPCLGTATISDHWEIPLAKADGAGELQPVDTPELVRVDGDALTNADEDAQVVEKAVEPAVSMTVAGSVISEAALRALIDDQILNAARSSTTYARDGIDKADLSTAGRKKAAASGAAMPDGSFPISTKADLRKAIKAVGRGGADHDEIRRHIITRAKALGLEAMVPTDWNADGSIDDTQKADLVAKAEQVLRDVRGLLPDLAKADDEPGDEPPADEAEGGDEAPDIATAGEAIAAIAKLIISEAESLAAGNINEACDIALLLDAVRSLKWFQDNERYEAESVMAEAAKTDTAPDAADTAKADAAAPQPDTEAAPQTPETPQVPDTLKADIADLVKNAVAEASKTAEERIDALAADLAKAHGELNAIKAQPAPGGPVLARTAVQQQQARNSDADRMRAEAAELMAKADHVSDRTLRDGYIERAQVLLAKADD